MKQSGIDDTRFEEVRREIVSLAGKVEAFGRHDFLKGPVEDFGRVFGEKRKETKLHVAVCGAHSAGKSTLVRHLTGREDIPVGQGPTTDKVAEYDCLDRDWTVVDTPGICSGHPEHDEKARGYMNRADLILYMIPSDRIAPEVEKDFKETIMARHAGQTMLLMGRLSDENAANLPAKRQAVAELVGGEDRLEAYRFCMLDVEDYLEGEKEQDEELKAALMEASRMEEFLDRLDDFLDDKGAYGKNVALLNVVEKFAAGAKEVCEAKEERDEIGRRQRAAIADAMERYRQAFRDAKGRMLRFLAAERQELQALFSENNEKAFRERTESLEDRLEAAAEDSVFQGELKHVFDDLRQTLGDIDEQIVRLDGRLGRAFGADIGGVQGFDMSKWQEGARQIGNVIANMSKETFVKIVHFFGGKFKPWGAAKWLKICKGFGAALPIAADAAGQIAEAVADAKMEEGCDEIRRNFVEIEAAVREFYDGYGETQAYRELQAVKEKLDRAEAGRRRTNEEKEEALAELEELEEKVRKCKRAVEDVT